MISKDLMEEVDNMHEGIRNISRWMKTMNKSWIGVIEKKKTISGMKKSVGLTVDKFIRNKVEWTWTPIIKNYPK